MIIYIILTIICLSLFIIIGKTNYQKENHNAIKFSSLYNLVKEDNLYTFSNAFDILNIINGRSGVILLGFPKNKYVNRYASILNDAAKELEIEKIYYYDFLSDRDNNNATYETIVKKLEMYVVVDDEGIQDLMAPTVLIVKNGEIIGYFDELNYIKGNISPEVYFNENTCSRIKQEFISALSMYLNEE